jgi:hypothetical protein
MAKPILLTMDDDADVVGAVPGRRQESGNGRRWRERCASAGRGGRWNCDRRRHKRRNLPKLFLCAVIPVTLFVVRAIELSRAAYQKMVGAMAMNLSTIIVALNAQLLRRVKLGP